MTDYIPKAARDLLAQKWQGLDAVNVERIAAEKDRREIPAYYYPRQGGAIGGGPFTYEEAIKLAKAGAFGPGWRAKDADSIAINEHACHSLDVFFTEVCAAWDRHLDRVHRLVILPRID